MLQNFQPDWILCENRWVKNNLLPKILPVYSLSLLIYFIFIFIFYFYFCYFFQVISDIVSTFSTPAKKSTKRSYFDLKSKMTTFNFEGLFLPLPLSPLSFPSPLLISFLASFLCFFLFPFISGTSAQFSDSMASVFRSATPSSPPSSPRSKEKREIIEEEEAGEGGGGGEGGEIKVAKAELEDLEGLVDGLLKELEREPLSESAKATFRVAAIERLKEKSERGWKGERERGRGGRGYLNKDLSEIMKDFFFFFFF